MITVVLFNTVCYNITGENMKILEYFTEGKIDNNQNEDGLFLSDNIIAVIDGVTTKTSNLYDGFKSGKIAKDILITALEEIDAKMNLEETFKYLNNALKNYYEQYGKDGEFFSAQIILYNDYYKEIWNFGDCNCMINNVFYNHDKLYDEITSNARILYNEALLKQGYTINDLLNNDLGAEYIKPLLQAQYLFDNDSDSVFGYPILNGNNISLDKIITYKLNDGVEVVLASDGYPIIENTLEKSELYLKKVLEEDPLCMNLYKSMKGLKPGNISYDDRAYVRFII
jgi:hypothetical protein